MSPLSSFFKKEVYSDQLSLTRSLDKPFENEGILIGQSISLKFCQPLELLTHFRNGIRSLYTSIIGSVGQRAAKSPAIKL